MPLIPIKIKKKYKKTKTPSGKPVSVSAEKKIKALTSVAKSYKSYLEKGKKNAENALVKFNQEVGKAGVSVANSDYYGSNLDYQFDDQYANNYYGDYAAHQPQQYINGYGAINTETVLFGLMGLILTSFILCIIGCVCG
eukprot:4534_1